MRLDKFLCETTELTRSLAKKAMHREEVSVDGEVVKNPGTQVDAHSHVEWQGRALKLVGLRYLMLHKPVGVECTTQGGRYPIVTDLVDLPKKERLQVVGRLDMDTTGLVLLTDDGQWSHRITSPRRHCAKVYRATLADPLSCMAAERAVATFAEGIELDGEDKPTLPSELELLTAHEVRLTIYEGKYHQVKRMFAAIGNHVESLHRESIGGIVLDPTLAPGEWRELSEDEIAAF
ncbi:pseudouridine synthase [Litchfieldella qijiaojingensis]|uniref:Pseudouridine synthase n=1 Tax=Litchfieldella qijiaojingensis TaxID=980347 RepID=A0ABQ2YC51_9GAMM|nr:pseudouridine synthase [Halomonas qijiaojingensis]GGX78456.1 pseudouridine synthase [Halomonas qijiaojingensis]